jgi:hypothetical protein
MSGKNRVFAIAAATAGIMIMWVPSALASTISAPVNANSAPTSSTSAPVKGNSGPVADNSLINGGVVNSGPVNVNLGSGNTADGDTCNNTNQGAPLDGDILSWAVGVTQNDCLMAGGPAHF